MPRTWNKVRTDANHKEIASHLSDHGCEVIDLSGVGGITDLLIRHKDFTAFMEIKIPGSRAAFTKKQLRWIASTMFPVAIVTDKESALAFATTGKGALTDSDKHRLRVLADTTDAQQVRPEAVERVLAI